MGVFVNVGLYVSASGCCVDPPPFFPFPPSLGAVDGGDDESNGMAILDTLVVVVSRMSTARIKILATRRWKGCILL